METKSSQYSPKTINNFKLKTKVKNQTTKKKRRKCQSKRHKFTTFTNKKTCKIADKERGHSIMVTETTTDQEREKISRTRTTGKRDRTMNSIYKTCTRCTTVRWCSSTIRIIKQTLRHSQMSRLLVTPLQTLCQEVYRLNSCREIRISKWGPILSFLQQITRIKGTFRTKVMATKGDECKRRK
jgi:hypothetical protein